MGTRPKATTNMNLSTIASLLLLAAVGTVAYPYEDQVMHWGAHQAPDGAYDSGADDSEDSVVPYEDQVMHWGAHQASELVQEAPQEKDKKEKKKEEEEKEKAAEKEKTAKKDEKKPVSIFHHIHQAISKHIQAAKAKAKEIPQAISKHIQEVHQAISKHIQEKKQKKPEEAKKDKKKIVKAKKDKKKIVKQ